MAPLTSAVCVPYVSVLPCTVFGPPCVFVTSRNICPPLWIVIRFWTSMNVFCPYTRNTPKVFSRTECAWTSKSVLTVWTLPSVWLSCVACRSLRGSVIFSGLSGRLTVGGSVLVTLWLPLPLPTPWVSRKGTLGVRLASPCALSGGNCVRLKVLGRSSFWMAVPSLRAVWRIFLRLRRFGTSFTGLTRAQTHDGKTQIWARTIPAFVQLENAGLGPSFNAEILGVTVGLPGRSCAP